MSANQQHWEALRKERVYQQRAFLRQQMLTSGADPSLKGTHDSELRAQQAALAAATERHRMSLEAAAPNSSSANQQPGHHQAQPGTPSSESQGSEYSAKLPNRFSSTNYAQQW